ncbi:MAG: prepilin-type N-terminal cleavage/methylation domain-containing protein [Rhodanobacter sp.]|nr:prepilin-type N-terminal cleavage/methylation domain-containing protein [Rhodanobacter sp.]
MKMAKNQNQGFTLVEVLLTLSAMTVLSAAIYMALKPTSATAQVKIEQDNLNRLSTSIDRSFGLLGTYAGDPVTGAGGVTTAQIIADGLAPKSMVSGTSLLTAWGTSAAIVSAAVVRPGDAFTITYPATPAEVCAKLAAAVSGSVYDLKIGGSSVMAAGNFDPVKAAQQCSQAGGATMVFVYHSGLVSGTVVAASPLELPSAPAGPGAPGAAPIATPAGPALPVAPVPPAGPIAPGAGSPGLPAPATSIAPSPAPAPVDPPVPAPAPALAPAPSGSPPPCQETSTTVTQNPACPAGQIGTWTRQQTVSTLCRDKENNYQAWNTAITTPGPWVDVVNTCAPACVAPAPTVTPQTQTVPGSASCPVGQIGSDTWTQNQSRTQSVVHVCSTPVGPLVDQPATYTAWTDVGGRVGEVNTCAPACGPAPAPVAGSQACPAGQTGTITTSQGWTSVAAPTCWAPGAVTQTSNTCAPAPPLKKCGDPCSIFGSGYSGFWTGNYMKPGVPECVVALPYCG